MFHELMVQVAETGGEMVLFLLLLASGVSMAIISERAWFLVTHRVDADQFTRQLLQHASLGDWSRARSVAQRSTASLCVVISAGLTQLENGRRAMRAALRGARLHEVNRLQGQLDLLGAVGRSALLLGLLGSLFDYLKLSSATPAAPLEEVAPTAAVAFDAVAVLCPAAAGLIVAIPAMLAASVLQGRVRHTLRQIDFVAQLLLLQVPDRKHWSQTEPTAKPAKPRAA